MPRLDRSTLEMALVGYAEQYRKIETAIAAIRSELGGRSTKAASSISANGAEPKRRLSAAARKRIALAQKKRWAAFHAKTGKPAGAKKTEAKRTLSPARKAALVANLAKARAARAAKRAAA